LVLQKFKKGGGSFFVVLWVYPVLLKVDLVVENIFGASYTIFYCNARGKFYDDFAKY
jgi:hypothetical protein